MPILNWLNLSASFLVVFALLSVVLFAICSRLVRKNNWLELEASRLSGELTLAQAQVRVGEARLADWKAHEEVMRSSARVEFESLAKRVIDQETKFFQESSEKSLVRLLEPFKERLKDFEKRVEETYQAEDKERHLLKSEVERLVVLNDRMSKETSQLTQALKGDSKFQGDWGELVLETILEGSGLREGLEYSKQNSLTDEHGDHFRPDILIHLPDGKQIIIDAKVSLKAFELYSHAENDQERTLHLKAHLRSLHQHVDELAEKHYPKLKGLRTPEFVFLFTPIEPAYLLALKNDSDLAQRAWKKGVAIVTSTTLFTSLKTVASIWRLEHQNRNALEIAQEAGKLYDKFVSFHEDFEKIGRTFESGVTQFEEARRKLREGPGNVFRKIELLRELGAAPNKRLKLDLLDEN